MEMANKWVTRDEIPSSTIDNLQNVSKDRKVSWENEVVAVDDILELLDVKVDDEPNERAAFEWRMKCTTAPSFHQYGTLFSVYSTVAAKVRA